MLRIVASEQAEQDGLKLDLDALLREGARRMLLAALKAEVLLGVRADGHKELVAVGDAFGSRPSRGPRCCAILNGAACEHPCWRSATVRWVLGCAARGLS